MTTITRLGNYNGNLQEAALRFHSGCQELIDPLNMSEKYGVFDNFGVPYLMIMSKSRAGDHPTYGHNLILTVNSDSEVRAKNIEGELELKTGIILRPAPEEIAALMRGTEMAFNVFKTKPELAMAALRKR